MAMTTGEASQRRIDSYITNIVIDPKITIQMIDSVKQKAIDKITKFPTYHELMDFIRVEAVREKKDFVDHKFQAEVKRLERIKQKFLPLVGQEGIDKYILYWGREIFGISYWEECKKFGITFKAFEKCALFDLDDGGGDVKKAIIIAKNKKDSIAL